jgi:hypothetical protein
MVSFGWAGLHLWYPLALLYLLSIKKSFYSYYAYIFFHYSRRFCLNNSVIKMGLSWFTFTGLEWVVMLAGQIQYVNYRQHPPFGFSVPFTLYFNSIYFHHNYTRNSYLLQLTFIKYTCVKTTRNRTLTFCFEKAKNIFLTSSFVRSKCTSGSYSRFVQSFILKGSNPVCLKRCKPVARCKQNENNRKKYENQYLVASEVLNTLIRQSWEFIEFN